MSAMMYAGPNGVKQWVPSIDGPVTDVAAWLGADSTTSKAAIRVLYHEVGFVRKMAALRSSTVAGVPWEISRKDKPIFTSEDDRAPEELKWLSGMTDILYRQNHSTILQGASYERILGEEGFRYMKPETIEPIWNKTTGELVRFDRQLNSTKEQLDVETVLYCWPFDPWVEQGPTIAEAEAMRTNASVVGQLSQFADKYLRRGALKNVIFNVPTGTSTEEKGRLKKLFDGLWGGSRNAGKAVVVEAGAVDATVIGDGLSDLGDMALTGTEKKGIADAFQIPHSIALDDAANFATAGQSDLRFLESVVIPDARKIRNAWNKQVLEPLGLWMTLRPDKIRAFQAAKLEQAEAAQRLVGRPIWTVEEGREFSGAPKEMEGELFVPTTREAVKSVPVEVEEELRKWERKASKNPKASFECYHVPTEIQSVVRDRLRVGFPVPQAFAGLF